MKLIRVLFVSLFLINTRAWAQLTVNKMAGGVEVQPSEGAPWTAASSGQQVPEGAAVRTGGDGEVELQFPDRSKVWVKPNSQLQVENQRPLLNRLSFLWGSIKAAIPHLKRNQKFEIRTNTAVAAVRGTEFTMDLTREGRLDLRALYGELRLRVEGVSGEFKVPQGQGFAAVGAGSKPEIKLLTQQEEKEGLEKWEPGLTQDERREDINAKQEARGEMREFARREEERQEAVKEAIQAAKEEDYAAGRTLTDIHGNLVRVDQRILRPAASELQVVNLVKRQSYNYSAGKFSAPSGLVQGNARLDSMQIRLTFSHDLPENLLAWPDFFDANDVKARTMKLILANQTDPANIFAVGFFGTYNAVTDEIEFGPTVGGVTQDVLRLGALSCAGATAASDCLSKLVDETQYLGVYDPSGGDTRDHHSSHEEGILRSFDAGPFNTAVNGTGTKLWLVTENYVIDNGGQVKKVDDIVKSGSDFFTILKNTAGQINLMVKKDDATFACSGGAPSCFGRVDNTSTGDYIEPGLSPKFGALPAGHARNIDLVTTPDIVVTLVQKLLLTLGDAGATN